MKLCKISFALVLFVLGIVQVSLAQEDCGTPIECYERALERLDIAQKVFEEKTADLETQITALELPVGTVAAFQLNECPVGWEFFAASAGRTIIGTGQSDGLTNRNLLDIGGEEMHTLTEAEMPSHTHAYEDQLVAANVGGWLGGGGNSGQAWRDHGIPTSATGGNQPHNNMPPYIALLFCKKQ
jgi:hypothetical protein